MSEPQKPTPTQKEFAEELARQQFLIEHQATLLKMRYNALRNAGFDHGISIFLCHQDWSNVK